MMNCSLKINLNCFPIQQLKNDVKLEKLVRLKSLELPNTWNIFFQLPLLNHLLSNFLQLILKSILVINQLIKNMMKLFFNLLIELKVYSEKNVLFVKKLLLEGNIDDFTESTGLSPDHVYKLFLDYLTNSIEAKLKSVHLEFIEKFFKENKNYGPFKLSMFSNLFSLLSQLLI